MKAGLLVSAGLLVVGAPLLWLRWRYVVATVEGRSMEPTLRAGDRLLVRRTRRVRAGQIVVLRAPAPPDVPPELMPTEEEIAAARSRPAPDRPTSRPEDRLLVKRAVAVPGDTVPRALIHVPETVVPPGALVVLGDNPDVSWDSREYGFVGTGQCIGVAIRRLTRSR